MDENMTTPQRKQLSLRIGIPTPSVALLQPALKTPRTVKAKGGTSLHSAVKDSLESLTETLESLGGPALRAIINKKDEHGYTPLMVACTQAPPPPRPAGRRGRGSTRASKPTGPSPGPALVKALVSAGADPRHFDHSGFTALHWAAACGDAATVAAMAAVPGVDLDARCLAGESPLHRAARLGRVDTVQALLTAGADAQCQNARFETPLDVAGCPDEPRRTAPSASRLRSIREPVVKAILEHVPKLRVLVLHHPDCEGHDTGDQHQEAPARVRQIVERLQDKRFGHRHGIDLQRVKQLCRDEAVLRVHSRHYLEMLKRATTAVRPGTSIPFTPMVQHGMRRHEVNELKDGRFSDTLFSAGSLRAAQRAAGGVVEAIDRVVSGAARHALCVVRPPGHHAGVEGLMAEASRTSSCGFCLLNSVAIGAFHALERHRDSIRRVAIVDFDVHHGNGTEEIIRAWAAHHPTAHSLFFFSTHLYDVALKEPASAPAAPEPAEEGPTVSPQTGIALPASTAEAPAAASAPSAPAVPLKTPFRTGPAPHATGRVAFADDPVTASQPRSRAAAGAKTEPSAGEKRRIPSPPSGPLFAGPADKRLRRQSSDPLLSMGHAAESARTSGPAAAIGPPQDFANLRLGRPSLVRVDSTGSLPSRSPSEEIQPHFPDPLAGVPATALDGGASGVSARMVGGPASLHAAAARGAGVAADVGAPNEGAALLRASTASLAGAGGLDLSRADSAGSAGSWSGAGGRSQRVGGFGDPFAMSRGWRRLGPRPMGGTLRGLEPGDPLDAAREVAGSTPVSMALSRRSSTLSKEEADKVVAYSFYPGSGLRDCCDANCFNAPIVPLWREPKPTGRARATSGASSVTAGGGASVGVATRRSRSSDADCSASVGSASPNATTPQSVRAGASTTAGVLPASLGSGAAAFGAVPPRSGREAVRHVVDTRLLPALRAFGPDLILFSAGFDGGIRDVGNSMPGDASVDGLNLRPCDFAYITRKVLEVSRRCCPGRVVSVLEGGYGQWREKAAASRVQTGSRSRRSRSKSAKTAAGSSATPTPAPNEGLPGNDLAVRSQSAAAGTQQGDGDHNNGEELVAFELNRDNLVDNCVAHLRALVEGPSVPAMEQG